MYARKDVITNTITQILLLNKRSYSSNRILIARIPELNKNLNILQGLKFTITSKYAYILPPYDWKIERDGDFHFFISPLLWTLTFFIFLLLDAIFFDPSGNRYSCPSVLVHLPGHSPMCACSDSEDQKYLHWQKGQYQRGWPGFAGLEWLTRVEALVFNFFVTDVMSLNRFISQQDMDQSISYAREVKIGSR